MTSNQTIESLKEVLSIATSEIFFGIYKSEFSINL